MSALAGGIEKSSGALSTLNLSGNYLSAHQEAAIQRVCAAKEVVLICRQNQQQQRGQRGQKRGRGEA